MVALLMQVIGIPESLVMAMLGPIHAMKYYLRTGYGESAGYFGGPDLGLRGGCQGNREAPSIWELLSTMCFNVHKAEVHEGSICCPVTTECRRQAGISFVDNNNLWVGLDWRKDLVECTAEAQDSIGSWGSCIHTTGGNFKLDKCHMSVRAQVPDGKGGYEYLSIA